MARMLPSFTTPDCSIGEREVFQRLRDDPGTKDWIVLHSLDISTHMKRVSGEADFIIIVPFKGVLCIEVKGCKNLRRDGGLWYYGNNPKPDPRGPFKQATEAMHSIRERLKKIRPELSHVVFWSGVMFPYVKFTDKTDEWHTWQLIDANDYRSAPISKLLEAMIDSARDYLDGRVQWFNYSLKEPDWGQCESIAMALRPDFECFKFPGDRAKLADEEIKYYTKEQYIALDAMDGNPRVLFTGPAGTGKTLLAIEAARRSSAANRRVLLICYNRLLGKWLRIITADIPNVVTKTIHRHMLDVWGGEPVDYSQEFWESELPLAAIEKLIEHQDDNYFYEELIVDEAQDILKESYLDYLDLCLKGGLSAGKWRFFGDFEKQSIFSSGSDPLSMFFRNRVIEAPLYSLRVNCRNTPRIASLAHLLGGLEPGYKRILRADDRQDPSMYYYKDNDEQKILLVNSLQRLYQEGFKGGDIVVLSPLAKNACATKIKISPWRDRLRKFEINNTDHIGYTSIYSFKGLEAPCIIVTDIEFITESHARSLFYIGVTRALNRLVILCHKSVKSEVVDLLLQRKKPLGNEEGVNLA